MFIQKPQIAGVPKKEFIIILQYLGNMPQIVKTRLTNAVSKHMKFFKLSFFPDRLKKLLLLQ